MLQWCFADRRWARRVCSFRNQYTRQKYSSQKVQILVQPNSMNIIMHSAGVFQNSLNRERCSPRTRILFVSYSRPWCFVKMEHPAFFIVLGQAPVNMLRRLSLRILWLLLYLIIFLHAFPSTVHQYEQLVGMAGNSRQIKIRPEQRKRKTPGRQGSGAYSKNKHIAPLYLIRIA